MTGEPDHTGGCQCGGVRYRISGALPPSVHCHCTMCRRTSGAPVVTWVVVPLRRFRFTRGEPRIYQSSDHARRGFCPTCGCQLTFYSNRNPEHIDVTVGTFDHPELCPPDRHIWASARPAWMHVDEHLPQYPEDTPPDHRPQTG